MCYLLDSKETRLLENITEKPKALLDEQVVLKPRVLALVIVVGL